MTLRKAIVSIMAMGVMMLASSCGMDDSYSPKIVPTSVPYTGYGPSTTAPKVPVTKAPAAPPAAPKPSVKAPAPPAKKV